MIFGEYHGTEEIPAFFLDVVCTMSRQSGDLILVGLELPEDFNSLFDDIGSTPTEELVDQIRANSFWRRYGDGRSSGAMLRLVEDLTELASARGRMELVAFAGTDTDGAGAALLARGMSEHAADRTLVLVGNAHARLQPMRGGPPSPMAAGLAERHGRDVLSLDISAGGGDAWACLWTAGPDPPPQCAARPVLPMQQTAGIHVNGCESCPYSGTYHIDRLSVAPAVDDD